MIILCSNCVSEGTYPDKRDPATRWKRFRKSISKWSTVFHELLQGDLPDEEKDTERLSQESQTIIGAGTETTAWSKRVPILHS
jgi:hypothetical protein